MQNMEFDYIQFFEKNEKKLTFSVKMFILIFLNSIKMGISV